jgi:hypothetical protein
LATSNFFIPESCVEKVPAKNHGDRRLAPGAGSTKARIEGIYKRQARFASEAETAATFSLRANITSSPGRKVKNFHAITDPAADHSDRGTIRIEGQPPN